MSLLVRDRLHAHGHLTFHPMPTAPMRVSQANDARLSVNVLHETQTHPAFVDPTAADRTESFYEVFREITA